MRGSISGVALIALLTTLHQSELVSCGMSHSIELDTRAIGATANRFINEARRNADYLGSKMIDRSAREFRNAGSQLLDDASRHCRTTGSHLIQETRYAGSRLIDDARYAGSHLIGDARDAGSRMINEGREALSSTIHDAGREVDRVCGNNIARVEASGKALIETAGLEASQLINLFDASAKSTITHAAQCGSQEMRLCMDHGGDTLVRVGQQVTDQVKGAIMDLAHEGVSSLKDYGASGSRAITGAMSEAKNTMEFTKMGLVSWFDVRNYLPYGGITFSQRAINMDSDSGRTLANAPSRVKVMCTMRKGMQAVEQVNREIHLNFFNPERHVFASNQGFVKFSTIMTAAVGISVISRENSIVFDEYSVACSVIVKTPYSNYKIYVSFPGSMVAQVPAAMVEHEQAQLFKTLNPQYQVTLDDLVGIVHRGHYGIDKPNNLAFYLSDHCTSQLLLEYNPAEASTSNAVVPRSISTPKTSIKCVQNPSTFDATVPYGSFLVVGDRILAPSGLYSIDVESDGVVLYDLRGQTEPLQIVKTKFSGGRQIVKVAALQDGQLIAVTEDGQKLHATPANHMQFATLGSSFGFSDSYSERLFLGSLLAPQALGNMTVSLDEGLFNRVTFALGTSSPADLKEKTFQAVDVAVFAKGIVFPLLEDLTTTMDAFLDTSLTPEQRKVEFRQLARKCWLFSSISPKLKLWGKQANDVLDAAISAIEGAEGASKNLQILGNRLANVRRAVDETKDMFEAPTNLMDMFPVNTLEEAPWVVQNYRGTLDRVIETFNARLL